MAIKKETVKKSKNLQQPARHCMIKKKGKYEYITFIILQFKSGLRLRRKGRIYKKKQGFKITSDLDYRNGSRTGFELKLSLHMIAGIISVVSLTLAWLNRHPVSRLYMP